jgi:hypothetical protein
MRLFEVLLAVVLLLLGLGGVVVLASDGAPVVEQIPRMTETCPALDLTGRPVVNMVLSVGETRCVYKRSKDADECPAQTPKGWTVVGKIDAPKNKDKVSCVYQNLGGTE